MARGDLRSGALAETLLAVLRAAQGRNVPREALAAALPAAKRHWLDRSLGTLVRRKLALESVAGFRAAGLEPPEPEGDEEAAPRREPSALPEATRQMLRAILRRAHAWRAAGNAEAGAELLQRAAEHVRHPAVAEDLSALSALFAHAPGLYRDLDLRAGAPA